MATYGQVASDAAAETHSTSGTVASAGGPLADYDVTLFSAGSSSAVALGSTTTAADGTFSITYEAPTEPEAVLYLRATEATTRTRGPEPVVRAGTGARTRRRRGERGHDRRHRLRHGAVHRRQRDQRTRRPACRTRRPWPTTSPTSAPGRCPRCCSPDPTSGTRGPETPSTRWPTPSRPAWPRRPTARRCSTRRRHRRAPAPTTPSQRWSNIAHAPWHHIAEVFATPCWAPPPTSRRSPPPRRVDARAPVPAATTRRSTARATSSSITADTSG